MQPLPPWPDPHSQGDADSAEPGQPSEDQVARWLLDLGGHWHLCGRSLLERHLVTRVADLPPRVSALLGAKLPPEDPRTDAILARLADVQACRGLQQLDLCHTAVGPGGLRHLGCWAWLESLDLSYTQIRIEDLEPLRALPELRQLDLAGTSMGALDHGDLFGQIDVPPMLRHPLAALQRGLGRLLDLQLVALALGLVLPEILIPSLPAWSQGSLLAVLAALLLIPLEGLGLALAGTTPGKSLLRVAVISETAARPTLLRSIQRAACACVLGFGAGLRPFSWFAASYWARALGRGTLTLWDQLAGTRCVPRQCSGKRLILALLLNIGLFLA